MNIPVLTILILIFVVWLQYEIRKNSGRLKADGEHFWQKEKEANLVRRKDISQLNYITVSLASLPLCDHDDDTLNSYRDTIIKLEGKKLLNLSGMSNTDLKYEYGAANLAGLTEYDNNYIVFVSMLHKWADRLYVNGYIDEAETVLEYGVTCLTDVTKSYRLLAEIYQNQNTLYKIDALLEIIPKTKVPDKEKLIAELKSIITQTDQMQ